MIPEIQTRCHLAFLLERQAEKYSTKEAFRYHHFDNFEWHSLNWIEATELSRRVSRAMLAMEVKVQENIGIFATNCLEFAMTDFGAWGIRVTSVPIYAGSSADQLRTIVLDADIRMLFVSGQQQYDMALNVMKTADVLQQIVIYNPSVARNPNDSISLYWDDFLALGNCEAAAVQLQERLSEASDDDLMSIIYTSGTMGESKGVMLTHGQLRAGVQANDEVMDFYADDIALSFLPYTHILEKGCGLFYLTEGCPVAILGDTNRVLEAMREIHPTIMCAVPRFWEKVYLSFMDAIKAMPTAKRAVVNGALAIGKKYHVDCLGRGKTPSRWLEMQYRLADKMVLSSLREQLGIRKTNFYPTGGAFITPEVCSFVHSVGLYLHVGYGQTESMADVTSDVIGLPFTPGSVGRPLKAVDVKIAEDGEICIKGPTVFKGYYKRPDLTAAAFDEDGYFHTGDLGYLKDGELFMTERKNDYYKLSTGKFVAPQLVESKLIIDPLIDQVIVIADRRKFVSALIVPDFQMLAKQIDGYGEADHKTLCESEEIRSLFEKRLEHLQHSLAQHEKVKRFALLPESFTVGKGELTNTLKMKRKVIAEHYKDVIDALYR